MAALSGRSASGGGAGLVWQAESSQRAAATMVNSLFIGCKGTKKFRDCQIAGVSKAMRLGYPAADNQRLTRNKRVNPAAPIAKAAITSYLCTDVLINQEC